MVRAQRTKGRLCLYVQFADHAPLVDVNNAHLQEAGQMQHLHADAKHKRLDSVAPGHANELLGHMNSSGTQQECTVMTPCLI